MGRVAKLEVEVPWASGQKRACGNRLRLERLYRGALFHLRRHDRCHSRLAIHADHCQQFAVARFKVEPARIDAAELARHDEPKGGCLAVACRNRPTEAEREPATTRPPSTRKTI